jgi:hypothetical protein
VITACVVEDAGVDVPVGYRKPDPDIDWLLYSERYPPLGPDLPRVLIMRDEFAERLWATMVDDADRRFYSYRELPPGHRLNHSTAIGPDWYAAANNPTIPDRVVGFLRHVVPWPDHQVVFYAHGPRAIFRLSWGLFLRHWRRFMLADESFVFGMGRPEFVLFADCGWLRVGDMRPGA